MSDGLTMQYRQEKLDEDIAKLEAALYGTPKESPETAEQDEQVLDNNDVITPDQSSNKEASSTDDPFATETAGEDTQPDGEELAKLRRQLSEEQHRFNRYKGKTDRTIFDLRAEVARLNKAAAQLKKDKVELQAKIDEADTKLDDDTRDIFGEEGASLIEGLKKEISTLKRQLVAKEADSFEEDADKHVKTNYNEFREKLQELVPELEEMNSDQGFNDWLRQEDDYGIERLATLRSDQARGDYVRVAQFFNEYKQLKKTVDSVKPKKKGFPDSTDAYTGPTGTKSDSSTAKAKSSKDGTILQSEINKYEKDVAAGKYKYDSAYPEAMEAKIFKAAMEDKIIYDVPPSRTYKVR